MTGQNRFINLRNSLAALYADEASLRRLLHDAGLDATRVMLTSSAINNWHAILIEAEKTNRLTTLMELALTEYPENPALQAAVAAGVNITYKLLYNGAVAMTGGQHPEGQLPVAAVAAALASEGVREILITTEEPEARISVIAISPVMFSSDLRWISAATELRCLDIRPRLGS